MLQPVGVGADGLPEQGGRVGELALAEGGYHRDEVAGVLQLAEFDLVELHRLGLDADLGDRFGEGHGGVLGITHIGAERDDQRDISLAGQRVPFGRAWDGCPTLKLG